jgi:hypothetical protein
LKVKIGVADANRVIEVETDDPGKIREMIDVAFAANSAVLWFEDTKNRLIGIPRDKIAFVEIDQDRSDHAVGFARASG